MEDKKLLNEKTYQKNKKKVILLAILVLLIGLSVGGVLVAAGFRKQFKINSIYSEENKQSLKEKINQEKQNLEAKKTELESKGIKYDTFAKYDEGEIYDLKILTDVLDPSKNYCDWNKEYQNNSLTLKYCSYIQQLNELNDFNKNSDLGYVIPFYMFGGFIILATIVASVSIYSKAKGREINAFYAQQQIPVVKEGIEEMTPTVGNAIGKISKEIKKGLDEDEK